MMELSLRSWNFTQERKANKKPRPDEKMRILAMTATLSLTPMEKVGVH